MNTFSKRLSALLCGGFFLMAFAASAAVVTATFNSAADIPVTAASYTATGNSLDLTLNFAPPVGTNLTVVKNTGLPFIQGNFTNLAQGQQVNSTYNGVTYRFIVNYFGGSGNDLVLQWAYLKAYTWGYNNVGQLGDGSILWRKTPVPVIDTGILAGKFITSLSASATHCLALCSDGTIAAWGDSTSGYLGTGSAQESVLQPEAVIASGALAGKTVVAVSAGHSFSLALCSDGTLCSWGYGPNGQLGNGTTGGSSVPVAVTTTGILSGKVVVAISAGGTHSLALCADGTLVSWGDNSNGKLGNGTTLMSRVPVPVTATGVLAGKTIAAISAGASFSLALCSDGIVAAWGSNGNGQLGDNDNASKTVPVEVSTSGILASKAVTAIAAGSTHSVALCSDGTVVSWGGNSDGQLGDNSTTTSRVPVAVTASGILAGKSVTAIKAGSTSSLAICADGTLATWGSNTFYQLGNGSGVASKVPVSVDTSSFGPEKIATSVAMASARFAATLVAYPLSNDSSLSSLTPNIGSVGPPLAQGITDYVIRVPHGTTTFRLTPTTTDSHATLTVNGMALASGTTSPPLPAVSGTVINLKITAQDGTSTIYILTVREDSTLASLVPNTGALTPAFSRDTTQYSSHLSPSTASVKFTATATDVTASIRVNGVLTTSGTISDPVPLVPGPNAIQITVTALDGTVSTYTVTVVRQVPLDFTFTSATSVAASGPSQVATANIANLALGFIPVPGTSLTVINNTGYEPIIGHYTNIQQGQFVELTYNNTTFRFVANYYAGTGNDLILQWANVKGYAWGDNTRGEIGNGTTVDSHVPMPIIQSGVLAGKTIIALSGGGIHTLALCSDGTLAAWGSNDYGQLGNGTTTNSSVPIAVRTNGVLAGKTVIAIAAGTFHSLALCSDGTLATWGNNDYGQLGNNATTTINRMPVAVVNTGVLAGRTVVSIAAGNYHNLALCSDGTLAGWGRNNFGELGDSTETSRSVPVTTNQSGVLAGKTITAISAGGEYCLALCSDGFLATWGYNLDGQLGIGAFSGIRIDPVAVITTGVLAGRTVTSIAAGNTHCLALCADGGIVAWGNNSDGRLGNGSTRDASTPVEVISTGVLLGKSVTSIATGNGSSFARCSDGSLAAWGYNSDGQLGNNSTFPSIQPISTSMSALATGEVFMSSTPSSKGGQSLAMVAAPLPTVTGFPATAILSTSVTLSGSVNAVGNAVAVSFEYGLDTNYGSAISGFPASVSGYVDTGVSAGISGLVPGATYHYRVSAACLGGIAHSADMTFTTLSDNASLAALSLSSGALAPAFDKSIIDYVVSVPFSTAGMVVTPTVDHPQATVKVNGTSVTSGSPSGTINLPIGNTTIIATVTAEDRITTKTYSVTVTRLPQNFIFDSATSIPVTADGFSTGGYPVDFVLNYPPLPGANLTAINNTGLAFIAGTFGNLAQGQRIALSHNGVTYNFVANYFGGTGNDLVLQWAATEIHAWGANNFGQLGDNSTTGRLAPVATDDSGVLNNKTIVSLAGGYLHSLALCSDGTLASWGYNVYGQLGNGGGAASSIPVAVDKSGALAGKTVIAISTGPFHNLALCSDGSIAAWGYNNYGQLGTGDKTTRRVPALVISSGALAGKKVVGIATGAYQSFARCADGSVVAWGYNDEGELGDNSTTSRLMPVAVDESAALANKKVVSLSAGQYHTLALCTDGTVVAWGYNLHGELGNNSTTSSGVPVAIGSFGILAGKTISSIAAGGSHSLALCTDGTLATWGDNNKLQLATTSVGQSTIPIEVSPAGATLGKTISKIAAGGANSMTLNADGSLAGWGDNSSGQLGNNTTTTSEVPSPVDSTAMVPSSQFMAVATGSASLHSHAIVGIPTPAPISNSLADASLYQPLLGDPDHDDIPNLIERAFALDPAKDSSGELPLPRRIGDNYVIEFTNTPGLTGITYGAESSINLKPGSWVDIPDTGSGTHHIFSVPADDTKSIFFRLKISE